MPAAQRQIPGGREIRGSFKTMVLEKDSSREGLTLHGRHVSIAVRRQRGVAILMPALWYEKISVWTRLQCSDSSC